MNRETYPRRPDLGRRLAPDADISRSDQGVACFVCLRGPMALGDDAGVDKGMLNLVVGYMQGIAQWAVGQLESIAVLTVALDEQIT